MRCKLYGENNHRTGGGSLRRRRNQGMQSNWEFHWRKGGNASCFSRFTFSVIKAWKDIPEKFSEHYNSQPQIEILLESSQ